MKNYEQILQKRLDIASKLDQLSQVEKEELQKPFLERSTKLLRFIYTEYSVYRYTLSEIDWILDTKYEME